MLFDGVLPFFILRVLEKPATGWVGSQFISLALLGGGGSIRCLVLPRWGVELWGLVVFFVVVGKAIL